MVRMAAISRSIINNAVSGTVGSYFRHGSILSGVLILSQGASAGGGGFSDGGMAGKGGFAQSVLNTIDTDADSSVYASGGAGGGSRTGTTGNGGDAVASNTLSTIGGGSVSAAASGGNGGDN